MICDETRENLLDLDCDEAGRQKIARALHHLQECASCREAMTEFDALTGTLKGDRTNTLNADQMESDTTFATPLGGWAQFERHLTPTPLRSFRAIAGIGIAASLLIGLLVGRYLSIEPRRNAIADVSIDRKGPADSSDQLTRIQFTAPEVTRGVKAFDQVSSVFDGRAAWLLVADNASDMGVSNAPLQDTHKVLLIRLTMLHSDQIISNADLIIVPGQTAKLTVPLAQGISAEYQINTSDDHPTHLAVWAQLKTPHGGEPLAALATTLEMETGDKRSAGTMFTSSGGYDLKIAFSRANLP